MDIEMKRLYEVRSTIKAFDDILDILKGTLKADIRLTHFVRKWIRYLMFYFDMHFYGSTKKKRQKRKERIRYNDSKFMRDNRRKAHLSPDVDDFLISVWNLYKL